MTPNFSATLKTVSVALFGALALTSMAKADVRIYGSIDAGFTVQRVRTTNELGITVFSGAATTPTDSRSQKTITRERSHNMSQPIGSSYIGIEASEQIGSLTVGTRLEGDFSIASGATTEEKLFNRETQIYVQGPWGRLAAGRLGDARNSIGSYNWFNRIASPFSGTLSDNPVAISAYRNKINDNSIYYESPQMGGVTGHLLVSLDKSSMSKTGFRDNDRLLQVGAEGEFGAINVAGVYTQVFESRTESYRGVRSLELAGNVDFQVAKVFASAGFYDKNPFWSPKPGQFIQSKGYKLSLGTAVPLGHGTLTATMQYGSGRADGSLIEVESQWSFLSSATATNMTQVKSARTFGIGARYDYPLSKRIMLFAGGYVGQDSAKVLNVVQTKKKPLFGAASTETAVTNISNQVRSTSAYIGIRHIF